MVGSGEWERRVREVELERENEVLTAARSRVIEEIARKGLEQNAATRIQHCWRGRVQVVVVIQSAVRMWLLRRSVTAAARNLGLKQKLEISQEARELSQEGKAAQGGAPGGEGCGGEEKA